MIELMDTLRAQGKKTEKEGYDKPVYFLFLSEKVFINICIV